jgi:hypothetical protein
MSKKVQRKLFAYFTKRTGSESNEVEEEPLLPHDQAAGMSYGLHFVSAVICMRILTSSFRVC